MGDTEVMDMVDTVESDLLKPNQKLKLKPNHTTDMVDTAVDTEDMVDTDMEVMVSDTDMVDTAESDLLMPGTDADTDMVVMDMAVDTDGASKLSFKFLNTIATSLQNYAIITAETSEHILPKKIDKDNYIPPMNENFDQHFHLEVEILNLSCAMQSVCHFVQICFLDSSPIMQLLFLFMIVSEK